METKMFKKKNENLKSLNIFSITDSTLSLEAKGLLMYILHLPHYWTLNMTDLNKRSKSGKDATKAAMDELIEKNYVKKKIKGKNLGKFPKLFFYVSATPFHYVYDIPDFDDESVEEGDIVVADQVETAIFNIIFLKDDNLSWKAKGILSIFHGMEDEELLLKDIQSLSTNKKYSVNSGIEELIENGYMIKKERNKTGNILSGYKIEVLDEPLEVNKTSSAGNPHWDKHSKNSTSPECWKSASNYYESNYDRGQKTNDRFCFWSKR